MEKQTRNVIVLVTAVLVFVAAASLLVLIPGWQQDELVLRSTDFTQSTPDILEIDPYRNWAQVGDLAPEFTLSDIDGNEVALSDFLGQPVMLNFWATWCAPCEIEMPEMQAVYEQYQAQEFVILALNQDEAAEDVATYFTERDLTFIPLLDTNMLTANTYGAFGTYPSSYFIDRDGIISARHIGIVSEEQMQNYLAEILPVTAQP